LKDKLKANVDTMLENENKRVKERAESEQINEKLKVEINELIEKMDTIEKTRIESEGMIKNV